MSWQISVMGRSLKVWAGDDFLDSSNSGDGGGGGGGGDASRHGSAGARRQSGGLQQGGLAGFLSSARQPLTPHTAALRAACPLAAVAAAPVPQYDEVDVWLTPQASGAGFGIRFKDAPSSAGAGASNGSGGGGGGGAAFSEAAIATQKRLAAAGQNPYKVKASKSPRAGGGGARADDGASGGGVVVEAVRQGGAAALDGRMRPGDRLLRLDGRDMRGMDRATVNEAVKALTGRRSKVKFQLQRARVTAAAAAAAADPVELFDLAGASCSLNSLPETVDLT